MQKNIKVKPKSTQQKSTEEADGSLTINLKSPPVDSKTNQELIDLLSKKFAVSKSKFTIKLGLSRHKLVVINPEN